MIQVGGADSCFVASTRITRTSGRIGAAVIQMHPRIIIVILIVIVIIIILPLWHCIQINLHRRDWQKCCEKRPTNIETMRTNQV